MADKQIMIDGVPVQDCCYFDYENDGYEDSCYIHQNECSAQNCYYKALKRKEQECEELKKDVIEALKLVEITSTHNTFQESRINKLSKTLTEIKDIAVENFYFLDCDYRWILEQILQKISEVE